MSTQSVTFPELLEESERIIDLAWNGDAPPAKVRNIIAAQRNKLTIIALRAHFGSDVAMYRVPIVEALPAPPKSNGKARQLRAVG